MAKVALIQKHKDGKFKFKVRAYNRCKVCGNPRGYMRKFALCRKCFRELIHKGELPGLRKASW